MAGKNITVDKEEVPAPNNWLKIKRRKRQLVRRGGWVSRMGRPPWRRRRRQARR